ncbi:hypothetical protein [Nocardia carnea]|uniref:Uncharacterized protein n=1 Tax=Nocardia carnea TaxID=37328 RepID=A0ABW7TNH3_9NOCA
MTTLLEALVGAPLRLELLEQSTTTAAELADHIRCALGVVGADPVIIRRSVLTIGKSTVVSQNSVVIVARHESAGVLTDRHRPIGYSMTATGHHLVRIVLGSGIATWSRAGATAGDRCVYKESLLRDRADIPVAHLNERISPEFAPLTGAL